MKPSDPQKVLSPDEARGAEKTGTVWKILVASVVLAVIAMIAVGQGAG